MKQKYRRNKVVGLNSASGWIEQMGEVRNTIKYHFESLFQEPKERRPLLDEVHFNSSMSVLINGCPILNLCFQLK